MKQPANRFENFSSVPHPGLQTGIPAKAQRVGRQSVLCAEQISISQIACDARSTQGWLVIRRTRTRSPAQLYKVYNAKRRVGGEFGFLHKLARFHYASSYSRNVHVSVYYIHTRNFIGKKIIIIFEQNCSF